MAKPKNTPQAPQVSALFTEKQLASKPRVARKPKAAAAPAVEAPAAPVVEAPPEVEAPDTGGGEYLTDEDGNLLISTVYPGMPLPRRGTKLGRALHLGAHIVRLEGACSETCGWAETGGGIFTVDEFKKTAAKYGKFWPLDDPRNRQKLVTPPDPPPAAPRPRMPKIEPAR